MLRALLTGGVPTGIHVVKPQRILVTGSEGLVGSVLCTRLLRRLVGAFRFRAVHLELPIGPAS